MAVATAEMTSFVGRQLELATAKKLIGSHRMVTLTGIGGIGKTRLATRLSTELMRAFPLGIWVVELDTLYEPQLLFETVAEALNVPASVQDPLERVVSYIDTRRILLVLDNCEHLLEATANVSAALLRRCPELRILATSREELGISGEAVLRLPTMATPVELVGSLDRHHPNDGHYDSVTLFTERARSATPDFALDDQNRHTVNEICRQLDGLPLAIELAAARLRVLTVDGVLRRLIDPYSVLTRGSRSAPVRHQTLQSSMQWSFDLCTPAEQMAWSRLSIFSDTFEIDAAEAMLGQPGETGPRDEINVLDVLQSLVEKSILIRDRTGGQTHFRMLRTIRQFGLRTLQASAEHDRIRHRHLDWYEQLGLRAAREWIGPRQAYWTARMDREGANLRDALEFCLSQPGEPKAAIGLMLAPWRTVWWFPGRIEKARFWMGRILEQATSPSELRSLALTLSAAMANATGSPAQAEAALQAARNDAEHRSDATADARVEFVAGWIEMSRGHPRESLTCTERALTLLVDEPLTDLQWSLLHLQSMCASAIGDDERAQQLCHQMLRMAAPLDEKYFRSYALSGLAIYAWGRDEVAETSRFALTALPLQRELGDRPGAAVVLVLLACVAEHEGDAERAALLLSGAGVVFPMISDENSSFLPQVRAIGWGCRDRTKTRLGAASFDRIWRHGVTLSVDEVIGFALGETTGPASTAANAGSGPTLTRREAEVARLVAQGLTNRAIATRLVISQRTAEGHVDRILAKLGFSSRTQLATWVTEHLDDRP